MRQPNSLSRRRALKCLLNPRSEVYFPRAVTVTSEKRRLPLFRSYDVCHASYECDLNLNCLRFVVTFLCGGVKCSPKFGQVSKV
jgi:hypothetical protein